MRSESYRHILEFDETRRKLIIWREAANGATVLYTEIGYDEFAKQKDQKAFQAACEKLGEVLIMDSPAGRKLFDL